MLLQAENHSVPRLHQIIATLAIFWRSAIACLNFCWIHVRKILRTCRGIAAELAGDSPEDGGLFAEG